jgi:aspartate/methionine/tyrosine aminotransferase
MIRPFGPTWTEGGRDPRRAIERSWGTVASSAFGSTRSAPEAPPFSSGRLGNPVRFPLADWIDDHEGCRYNLGKSGMRGTIRHPLPTRTQVRDASEPELRRRLADRVGVSRSRLFVTHGASEANSLAIAFLSRRPRGRSPRCRVRFPEYPPLYDTARTFGYRVVDSTGPVDLAVASLPRNPEGCLWSSGEIERFTNGARATLIDETFREFTTARSVQRLELPSVWSTGTFTKAYGADDLRVGYVVTPEAEADRFARFHGLVTDEIAEWSVAGALATLDDGERILRDVRRVFERNRAAWRRATPRGPELAAPVAFDDPVPGGGDRFTLRCLRASILVCPGSLLGKPSGVRVCLTRRSFPRDLAVYRRVRDGAR